MRWSRDQPQPAHSGNGGWTRPVTHIRVPDSVRSVRWGRVAAVAPLAAIVLGVCVWLIFQANQAAGKGGSERGLVTRTEPPPADGYFRLRPVGSYSYLPGDRAAGAAVHRSTWEARPGNGVSNKVVPVHLTLSPANVADHAYDPRWNTYVLRRITGNFIGTTDEIFQWAAVKWGVPDNLIRTVAFMESGWEQSNYGDYVDNPAKCPPGYTALPCPVTFGIVGTKSTSWPGIFPWNRDSTAASVDSLGGWLRGCDEGWVWWLRDHGNRSRGVYAAGDIWGCVGAWFSGNWHDGAIASRGSGEGYIHRAQHWYQVHPWLRHGF